MRAGWGGGEGVCLTHSVQKVLHSVGGLLQAAAASLQHWPGDTSYQITLMAATSQSVREKEGSPAVVNGLMKKKL